MNGRIGLAAGMVRGLLSALLAVAIGAGTAADERQPPNHYPDAPDATQLVYKTAGDTSLHLWKFAPDDSDAANESGRPAVVFFFGGGWRSGTPQQFVPHCRHLQSRRMVCFVADYRVSSRHGVKAVDCVEDAKSAIRWVRSHAGELGVDPNRICAAGGSAGGHLACSAAVIEAFDADDEDSSVSSQPNACVLFNPAVLLWPIDGQLPDGVDADRLAGLAERTGVPPQELSPAHHVRPDLRPMLILHGEADTTVPFSTVRLFTDRMTAAGNRCELIGYPGAPHGFFNWRDNAWRIGSDRVAEDNSRYWYGSTLLRMDEFLVSLGWIDGPSPLPYSHAAFARVRGSLTNSWQRFQHDKQGHVAFLGGSITEMNGYRPLVEEQLRTMFPDTDFEFTNAGIASTCSTTGAFRLERDVLSHGPVDLLIVEFAVNDDQDAGHAADDCVRGMEGIIARTREHNPHADIVMVHFVNPGMLEQIQAGDEPLSSAQHERVARHWHIPSVDLSRRVASLISTGELTWNDYGGTHPGPIGNQLAADAVVELLQAAWRPALAASGSADRQPHPVPDRPLLDSSYDHGNLVLPKVMDDINGWTFGVPDWETLPGSKRDRFVRESLWYSDQPGAAAAVSFHGTAIGAYVLAGPDAGQLDVQIDDGSWQTIELYHHYSRGLHYPRTVMFARDLPPGDHRLTIRVGDEHHADSKGTAVRILAFAINE